MRELVELTENIGVLARPQPRLRMADELVSFLSPSSFEADQYRALRQRVEQVSAESGGRVFAVTSAAAGEGKTVTTLNLAGSLAQSPGARVLVIEADLRRSTVAKYLQLPDARVEKLTSALLSEDCRLSQLTRRLDALNISVVLGGDSRGKTYELLASHRFQHLLSEARVAYDYVLVDTPPLLPLADSRALGRWVDGYIFVVAAHRTPRPLIVEALGMIDRAKLVALAFNGDDRPLSTYRRYYGLGQPART